MYQQEREIASKDEAASPQNAIRQRRKKNVYVCTFPRVSRRAVQQREINKNQSQKMAPTVSPGGLKQRKIATLHHTALRTVAFSLSYIKCIIISLYTGCFKNSFTNGILKGVQTIHYIVF
jgi:hypothetical protein